MKQEKNQPMLNREYLTKKELEDIYGLRISKVNNLMRLKLLIFYKIEREVRFKKTDIDRYFEQNKIN